MSPETSDTKFAATKACQHGTTPQKVWGRKVYGVRPIKIKTEGEFKMKLSQYKSYDDLPLFLNSDTVAKALGISPSSAYELMHEKDFPTLRIGSRMVVPKEKFIRWVEEHTNGGDNA